MHAKSNNIDINDYLKKIIVYIKVFYIFRYFRS